MMKKLFTTFAIALTLTLVGCGSTESQATNTEYKEETTTTTTTTAKIEEPKEEETTTTTAAPAESEPETTTTAEPEPVLEALVNYNEISPEQLEADERQIFEDYIKENNLNGKFYDGIKDTFDTPKFYFIPSDELKNGEYSQTFCENTIYIMVPIEKADEYMTQKYIDSLKEKGTKYVVIRNLTKNEAAMINTEEIPYYYIECMESWWDYIGNVFVPAE